MLTSWGAFEDYVKGQRGNIFDTGVSMCVHNRGGHIVREKPFLTRGRGFVTPGFS